MKNNIIYFFALTLMLGAGGLIYLKKSKAPVTPPPQIKEPVAPEAPPESPEKTDNQARIAAMHKIFAEAQADYQKFLAAESANDVNARRKYYKHAKIKLDEVINLANSVGQENMKDVSIVQKAIQLRTDLGKKSYTED